MEILLEPTSNKLLILRFELETPNKEILNLPDHSLDDGVATSFQRSRIHKPHAHTYAFKVNHSTSRPLILNFPTIKERHSQTKNHQLGKIVRLIIIYVNFGPITPVHSNLQQQHTLLQ
ncbi:hypothetical protein Tco_0806336 [Tanacetum coccineum]